MDVPGARSPSHGDRRRPMAKRALACTARAEDWLARDNVNITAQIDSFHLEDLAADRPVDARVRAVERRAAWFVDEQWGDRQALLPEVADEWDRVGRGDLAAVIRGLAPRTGPS